MRFIVLLCLVVSSILADGLPVTMPFVEPCGTRSRGMGQTGYALADDESALFFNPAGLGIANYRWNGGTAGAHRESFKDVFPDPGGNRDEYTNTSYSLIYQNDFLKNTGFGVNVYRQVRGTLAEIDSFGTTLGKVKPYVMTAALGGGYTLFPVHRVSHSFGVTAKYFQMANYVIDRAESPSLAQKIAKDDPWQTASFDAGYILNLFNCLRVGLVMKNVGPGIRISDERSELYFGQPLTFAAGIGFKRAFGNRTMTVLDLANEISFTRSSSTEKFEGTFTIDTDSQAATPYSDRTTDLNRTFATGIELLFLRTIALRFGYDYSRLISEYKNTGDIELLSSSKKSNFWKFCLGFGLRLFNHFEADVYTSEIHDDDEFSFSNHRTGFSLTYTRALNWKKSDLKWWRRVNPAR